MSRENALQLKSSDDQIFNVDESVALEFQLVKNMLNFFGEIPDEIDCHNAILPIPLANVCGKTLRKVIKYCEHHLESQSSNENPAAREKEVKQWDAEFVKVDQAELFDLILAANYLDIKKLVDLTCQAAADMLQSKTVEEIRTIFHVQSDFSSEEEKDVMRDSQWAF